MNYTTYVHFDKDHLKTDLTVFILWLDMSRHNSTGHKSPIEVFASFALQQTGTKMFSLFVQNHRQLRSLTDGLNGSHTLLRQCSSNSEHFLRHRIVFYVPLSHIGGKDTAAQCCGQGVHSTQLSDPHFPGNTT